MNFFDIIKDNPFYKAFESSKNSIDKEREKQSSINAQGRSYFDLDQIYSNPWNTYSDVESNFIDFSPMLKTKMDRITKYREMYIYPEIADAVDSITNDAITDNGDGDVVHLQIKNKNMPENVEKRVRAAFNYWVYDILKLHLKGAELYKKWLIDGELFLEIILNDKKNNIIDFKILPPYTIVPIYKNSRIKNFVQYEKTMGYDEILQLDYSLSQRTTIFNNNQVAYSNWGDFGSNLVDVRGYLESAIRVYNQLKSLEDSIIVYRLVRAPERRLWNIYTGKLPKGKAEEYMKGLIQRYRKKNVYDPSTGAINSAQNIQSLSEDYWFSKDAEGNGTTVDTLQGAENLGEINDLNYFLEKLYKSLKLPRSRWSTNNGSESSYSPGRGNEITREEVRFSKFIENTQAKFQSIILDPFLTLLNLRGIDQQYTSRDNFSIVFSKSNLFKEFKEMEVYDAKLGLLATASSYISTYENKDEPSSLFSKEYVLKHIVKMNDEQYRLNEDLKEKEIEKQKKEIENSPDIETDVEK